METSREFIKPSSPTPHHLKSFKLSSLDQSAPLMYFPFVYFYPPPNSTDAVHVDDKITLLKHSLSQTLARFYPIAGRIKDSTTIDCNDHGVLYIQEKQSNLSMIDCLSPPKIELLDKFLPCEIIVREPPEIAAQLAIKVNIFECGGIALGMCFLHKLIDAATFTAFVRVWAAVARQSMDDDHVCADNRVATVLFPPNEHVLQNLPVATEFASMAQETKPTSIQRFVFDEAAILKLKDKAKSKQVPNPSRSGVVSALLWKCALNAYHKASSHDQSERRSSSLLTFSINLRSRLNPPLPYYSVGNIFVTKTAKYELADNKRCDCDNDNDDEEVAHLVSLIRERVNVVDSEYVEKLQGKEGYKEINKSIEEEQKMYGDARKPVIYGVASMCQMGFYETDFGWGKPIWVALGPVVKTLVKNWILQKETRGNGGIEAWVVLDEEEMRILQTDPLFLSFVTINPHVSLSNSEQTNPAS